ncbi:Protein ExoD [Candidatus Promineifilum breve]|uniref:Protein ExoD n=1 Tax=Candidatus Promineifilum breve TaxID=1806508 RepID=A0A160T5N8_9CHLR|nr:exopolysaccharide biosynthesis protein [Candidatus Promineifilum breve]CUS05691.1 Protein ExoD [Candidatus Promineifilum breve]
MDDSTTIEFRDSAAPLGETLRQLARSIEGERVTVRELLSMVGEQGLLLALMFLTVPFLLPISIPGVSTVFGAVAILISLGITFNRVPWLPDRLLDRPLDAVKLTAAIEKGADRFGRVDRISHPRLQRLTDSKAMNRLAGLGLLLGSTLLIFPLGLVPFSNTLPAWGILLLAAGQLQRDGLLILLGYLFLLGTLVYFAALGIGVLTGAQWVVNMFQ